MITENIKIEGKFKVYQKIDGVRTLVSESTNVITRSAKYAILRSLAQSSAGTKLDGTFFINNIALCTRVLAGPPGPWDNHALTSISSYQAYQDVVTPSNVSIGASDVTIHFEATWENTSGSDQTIDILATNIGGSPLAENLFSVSGLGTAVKVFDGDPIDIDYYLSISY